jgi:pyruvate dehydrogenase E1 component beta subunit
MPTFPKDAKGLLLASIADPNPVIFLEHRWLHNQTGDVPEGFYTKDLSKPEKIKMGSDITIVSLSFATVEAIRAVRFLNDLGISVDLFDLQTVSPLNLTEIEKSVEKTGRLLVLDTAQTSFGVSGEIVSRISKSNFSNLLAAPERLGLPDMPIPTSPALTDGFYYTSKEIIETCYRLLKKDVPKTKLENFVESNRSKFHDVPGDWFKGPF